LVAVAPTRIGRYELHTPLASGGMAMVYLGRMRMPTGSRTVALKRMHPHFAADPGFAAMFHDEARLAMRLQHPNIVTTLDVVSAGGELLLVMEYVHGESLAGLARAAEAAGERIPPAVASSILCGVLAGLHAAHEARGEDGAPLEIVHRDVSPQNVVVGVDGVARLLDFGVAKAAGRMQSTVDGQVKGKFAYMAPEQLTSGMIDRRVDVFAAAVVVWETMTGARLFRGESPGAVVTAVLATDVPAPSAVAPSLPPELDAVVLRGLARQKRERYETARELAVALESAVPPATTRAVGEWVERLAAASLSKREALVRDVERSASTAPPPAEVRALAGAGDVSGANEVPTRTEVPEGVPVASVASSSASRRRRPRWPWVVAAGVALVALPVGAVSLVRSSPTTGATEAVAEPPASLAAPPSPAPSDVANAVSAAPAEPTASVATPSAPSAARAAPPRAAPPPVRAARPRATAGKPDCSNPFVVDARGIRVPRPECF
jgi:serine/threonine-protein kinase